MSPWPVAAPAGDKNIGDQKNEDKNEDQRASVAVRMPIRDVANLLAILLSPIFLSLSRGLSPANRGPRWRKNIRDKNIRYGTLPIPCPFFVPYFLSLSRGLSDAGE